MCIYIHIYIYIYIYAHTHIYIYIYVNVCVCVCVFMTETTMSFFLVLADLCNTDVTPELTCLSCEWGKTATRACASERASERARRSVFYMKYK